MLLSLNFSPLNDPEGINIEASSEGAEVNTMLLSHFSHVQLFATPWTIALSRLHCPWDFPGNTGVGCHFLLQEISRSRDQTRVP